MLLTPKEHLQIGDHNLRTLVPQLLDDDFISFSPSAHRDVARQYQPNNRGELSRPGFFSVLFPGDSNIQLQIQPETTMMIPVGGARRSWGLPQADQEMEQQMFPERITLSRSYRLSTGETLTETYTYIQGSFGLTRRLEISKDRMRLWMETLGADTKYVGIIHIRRRELDEDDAEEKFHAYFPTLAELYVFMDDEQIDTSPTFAELIEFVRELQESRTII